MNNHSFFSGTGTSTAFGTLIGIVSSIQVGDIFYTAVMAAIGATVSFIVTLVLKYLLRNKKR